MSIPLQGNTGLGFAIQEGSSDGEEGIYVKSLTPGGVAATQGELSTGDRLLRVQEHSLLRISYSKVSTGTLCAGTDAGMWL